MPGMELMLTGRAQGCTTGFLLGFLWGFFEVSELVFDKIIRGFGHISIMWTHI